MSVFHFASGLESHDVSYEVRLERVLSFLRQAWPRRWGQRPVRQLGDPVPARVFSDKAGPGAGPAVTADRFTPTESTIPTAAAGLHYKGVSAEAFWLSEIRPSHSP